ncbi:uncharacterized protein [Antedon mediterranea]|uniref:uncharacterized protein n=1 Tax=Antedon mediterranea TaxID=105859 RepID=UPI003AF4E9FE
MLRPRATNLLRTVNRTLHQYFKMATNANPRVSTVFDNLNLHAIGSEGSELKLKPVVLFIPWMGSTKKAEDKFRSLYHSRGYDTLTYYTNPKYFLWPNSAMKPSSQLLDFMDEKTSCPVIVHGFSIGAYFYAVMLRHLLDDTTKWLSFRQRVKGQIFDSLTIGSVKNMVDGVARFSTSNKIAQKTIILSLLGYFKLTKKQTKDIFDKMIDAFYNNPMSCMGFLTFFSKVDPLCDYESMIKLIEYWEKRNIKVQYKCWDDTPHCRHYQGHKDEYELLLDQYLSNLKLPSTMAKL